ncbi:DEAD/DEAH box helicase family protein [Luteimonas sp. FCS-9]|uniref:DEAD/DEAH box helicase family protein n=1 Tax=Luteimonas sp. FCS-9 TaxID=1547516 RepID=UPI00063EA19E|nr:DEAD/DEAH box helicase family protein [Luteimonas sp. FCS-9]KLJ02592.1 DEAD/DEAH box helicase [Luteimonas sp. FCS-9]
MVFKRLNKSIQSASSPEKLIFDLPRRKIPGVLTHQSEVMRNYAETATEKADVALQLPTGSGKTLVGSLIAEWLRRKRGERVVYLAPTKQLVNQVATQCEAKYGIQANGFTGKATNYTPHAKSEYRTGEKIAVTTYSSLFNTNPFFNDADVIIIDDAHAAENYISSMWSVSVIRINPDHESCFLALIAAIKPYIDDSTFYKLKSTRDENNGWVDKLPSPSLAMASGDIRAVLDEHSPAARDIHYPWSLIRDHLHGCHFYYNESEILIRPLIPPTWTHSPFTNARQRIYMSATLGSGGDLERLFGRKNIHRIAVPEGWDKQGVGRRLFLFPGLSLDENNCSKLRLDLMQMTERSLVLVPSKAHGESIRQEVENKISFQTLDATDIENTKETFTSKSNAVAIIANRYDGIDFPGDECRLTFVEGLPSATNLQEKFLMSRMAANVLFNERIQTRVLQAIGRCTRSLEDYSAVVVNGLDLQDYLVDKKRRRFLHPEIQAELQFGIEQSMPATPPDFCNFMRTFLGNGEDWESANQDIIELRDSLSQDVFPAISDLESSVPYEIDYQKSLWQGDFVDAMEAASRVIGVIRSEDLKGYRALWNYLAGSSALLAKDNGQYVAEEKSDIYFTAAKNAAVGLRWLVNLATSRGSDSSTGDDPDSVLRTEQIENIENVLERLGSSHDRRYAAREKKILDGLLSEDEFETAQVLLGELLGFNSSKRETDGSPDPWWHIGNLCFVFEDHAGAKETSSLSVEKARQAADHPRWIRQNVPELKSSVVIPILVTPTSKSSPGAKPHLNEVYLWPLSEYRTWAQQALVTIREIRKTFSAPGDIAWRAEAITKLRRESFDAPSIKRDRLLVRASDRYTFN